MCLELITSAFLNIHNKYLFALSLKNLCLFLNDLLLHFHSTGIGNSQNSFSCGPVCLLAEWSCFYELTNNKDFLVLLWTLKGLNMQQVGDDTALSRGSDSPGTTDAFAERHFLATVTNVTQTTITSVATGTINQTIDGHTLQCIDVVGGGVVVGDAEISIPGKFIQ